MSAKPDVRNLKLTPEILRDAFGKPEKVVLDYSEYKALLEYLEDQIDLAIFDERVKNAGQSVPLRDIIRERQFTGN